MARHISSKDFAKMTLNEIKSVVEYHCNCFGLDDDHPAHDTDITPFETFLLITELFKRLEG
jgi:hypothetical protein